MNANQKEIENLSSLYQEVIVDHAKKPRNKGRPLCCKFCQDGKNPLCGDQVTIYCSIDEEKLTKTPVISVNFEGSGCSISQASASMMCECIQNVSVCEARKKIVQAENIYTGKINTTNPDDINEDVEALAGVAKFPVRIKCAALPWKSLELLLNEHFDINGFIKNNNTGCEIKACTSLKKLKIISTEHNL